MSTSDVTAGGTANGRHPSTTAPTTAGSPDAIRADIEQTRADLAETVDALHAKLDVKTQARAKAAGVKDSVTTDTGKPRPEVLAVAAGALVLVAALVWWRRR